MNARVDGGPRLFHTTIATRSGIRRPRMAGQAVDVGADGIIAKSTGDGIVLACGTALPANGVKGYAKHCIFMVTVADASGAYLNNGTISSCAFVALNT